MSGVPEADPVAEIRRCLQDVLAPISGLGPLDTIPLVTPAQVDATGAVASDVASGPTSEAAGLPSLTDEELLRFFVGRKRDIKATVDSIRQYLGWRAVSGANEVLSVPFPDFQLFRIVTPHSFHKHDLEGNPLYFERSGAIDVTKVVKVIDEDALIVRHIWAMELLTRRCIEATARFGKPISKNTVVFDLAHLSLAPNSTGLALFRATLHIDQHYYPERLHKAFFINAPWIFKGLWAVISPWIDPVTKAKFHILGSDYRETLLQHIAPDCLPVEYGGTCTCGTTVEEGHPTLSSCVSPACTLSEAEMLTLAGYRTVRLGAGAVETLDHACVPDGNAVIWQWHADDKDVLFKAEFIPTGEVSGAAAGAVTPSAATLREETKEKSDKGWYLPEGPGRVVLTFSNAHSRFTAKNVHVRLSGGHSVPECRLRSLRPFSERKAEFAVDAPAV